MSKKKMFHVKVGDSVRIISGFYKNEVGEIIKIDKKTGYVNCSKNSSFTVFNSG